MKNPRSWITEEEAECLARYASKSQGHIVELGTFRGGTAEMFAQVIPAGYVVFSVDRYHGREFVEHRDYDPSVIYNEYLLKYGNAFLIVADSALVASYFLLPIGLLFIDCNHDYEHVKSDWLGWSAKVIKNGYIIFHDYGTEGGVTRFVDELVSEGFELIEQRGTLAVMRAR